MPGLEGGFLMSRKKVAIWFAKGFSARCRHVEFEHNLPAQVGESQVKRQAYMEGWEWCNGLMRHNLEPYTEDEVDTLSASWWRKSRQIA